MTFTQALSGYIGNTVEVVLLNEIFAGTLDEVPTHSLIEIVETMTMPYVSVGTEVHILTNKVEYVRIPSL